MTPQIGDPVIVRYQGLKPVTDGFVFQGATAPVQTVAGTLGVEADEDGRVSSLVIQSDGGATFVPRGSVISVEADQ